LGQQDLFTDGSPAIVGTILARKKDGIIIATASEKPSSSIDFI